MPAGWLKGIFQRGEDPPETPPAPDSPPARRKSTAPERLAAVNFDRFVSAHPRVVVDVWAPWCAPCRAFAPTFAAASTEWGDRVAFGKVHADHEPSLVRRFGVRSIPSLLFFREGELVRTEVGIVSADRLSKLLRKVFRDLP